MAYRDSTLDADRNHLSVTQLPYQSRITDKEEKLPMVVSLMGAPGTDMRLLEWIIDSLRKSNRPTKVQSGKVAFDTQVKLDGKF